MSQTFSYVKYDEEHQAMQAQFKAAFESLERMVMTLAAGRPRSLVLTKLEEAYMWIGKAIRDDQIAKGGSAAEETARG